MSIHIDENKENFLTSITNAKTGVIKHESDHNSIVTEFDIEWEEKPVTKMMEIFNFKDKVKKSLGK